MQPPPSGNWRCAPAAPSSPRRGNGHDCPQTPHGRDIQYIVSGGARGADRYGEQYGKEYGIDLKIYLPEWDKYDKAAGYIRNKQIVEDSDIIFAFWDGESKGTKHSIDLAPKMKKKIIVTKFEKKNPISESSISILQKLLSKIKN